MKNDAVALKEKWAAEFVRFRERLTRLAQRNMNPVMAKRVSAEDLVAGTFANALNRIDFFENEPDVPVYFKLRRIFFQTLADEERRHLKAGKRDAYRDMASDMDAIPSARERRRRQRRPTKNRRGESPHTSRTRERVGG